MKPSSTQEELADCPSLFLFIQIFYHFSVQIITRLLNVRYFK